MRNLNDIEAKALLLLNEIEAQIKNSDNEVPWQIIEAAGILKMAINAEDARLGADLLQMADKWRKYGT